MRVLHLNTHSSGGSYEYAALLSTALVEQGIESQVLCKNSSSAQTGRPLLDRIIRRSYVSLSTEPWHGTRRLLSPPAAADLDGVDIVHLHTVADWFDVPSWLEILSGRVGVVISLHDMWHFTGGCFLYRGCNLYGETCNPCPILKSPMNRFLAEDEHRRKLRAYGNRVVHMVANSRWLAGIAKQSPVAKACGGVLVIPPGIDTAIFRPQDKRQCRQKQALPEDTFVIATGSASLTDKNKNVPWLLQQLSRLPDRENIMVLVVGEGSVPVRDGLSVRFAGPTRDRYDLARLLTAADVFISASQMETYSLTLVEAMACGTPVVAFRVGGIPEAVPDGKVGILCEPLDGAAFLAAIESLRNSAQLRNDLGNAGSKLVSIRNHKAQFAAAFASVYRDCVETQRGSANNQHLAAV